MAKSNDNHRQTFARQWDSDRQTQSRNPDRSAYIAGQLEMFDAVLRRSGAGGVQLQPRSGPRTVANPRPARSDVKPPAARSAPPARSAARPKAKPAAVSKPTLKTFEQLALKEWQRDANLQATWKGSAGALRYCEFRAAEMLREKQATAPLKRRPGLTADEQAAAEWKENVFNCRDRFSSETTYRNVRRRELAGK